MSTKVEQRVVEMRFDNAQFERNIAQSTESLDKLKEALRLDDATKSFEDLEKAAKGFDLSGALSSVTVTTNSIKDKFDGLLSFADGFARKLGGDLMGSLQQIAYNISQFSILGQFDEGFGKYSEITQSVQTISSAGYSMEEVAKILQKLTWFADETSYGLSDMTSNIAKFTAQNVPLEQAATAMQGIATWSARSGQTPVEAARAMYNLSQALSLGAVTTQDWKSIEIANMATAEFKETALEAAAAEGVLTKNTDGTYTYLDKSGKKWKEVTVSVETFRNTLSSRWFDDKVLLRTLEEYGKATELINKIHTQSGLEAYDILNAMHEYMETGDIVDSVSEKNLKNGMTMERLREQIALLSSEEYKLSRESFEMAQNAITLGQALDYVKDAASTGWANIFQSIFGNFEQSKNVWSTMAEDLGRLFVEPVTRLGDYVNKVFASPYEKIEQTITESGGSVEAFRKALTDMMKTNDKLAKYVGEDGKLIGITFDELFRNGDIKSSAISNAIRKLAYDSKAASGDVKDLAEKVRDVIRGNYGNGQARKNALGDEYERVQKLVNEVIYGKGWSALDNLTAAELENLGMTEDEIKAFKEMYAQIQNGDSVIEEYAENFDKLSGRELFANTLHNVLGGLANILDHFRNAWDEVFGGIAGEDTVLYGVLERMNDVSEAFLNFTDPDNESFISGFAFALMDSFKTVGIVLGGLGRIIGKLISFFNKLFKRNFGAAFDGLSEGAEEATQRIVPLSEVVEFLVGIVEKLVDAITNSETAQAILTGIGTALRWVGGVITAVFGWIQSHAAGISGLLNTLWGVLVRVFNTIKESTFVQTIWEHIQTAAQNLFNTIESGAGVVGTFLDSFAEKTDGAEEKFEKLKQAVTDTWGVIKEWYSNLGKNSFDLSGIMKNLIPNFKKDAFRTVRDNVGGLFGFTSEDLDNVGLAAKSISSIGDSVKKIGKGDFSQFTQMFQGFADTYASVVEKAKGLDFDKLFVGAAGATILGNITRLTATFKQLADTFKAFQETQVSVKGMFDKIGNSFTTVSTAIKERMNKQGILDLGRALLMMAAAVGILALAFWALSKIPDEDIENGMRGLGTIVIALMAMIFTLGLVSRFFPIAETSIGALVPIAVALLIFGYALEKLSTVKWDNAADMVYSLLAAIVVFAVISRAAKSVNLGGMLTLVAIPLVLLLFVEAIKRLVGLKLTKAQIEKLKNMLFSIIMTISGIMLFAKKLNLGTMLTLLAIPVVLMLFAKAFEKLAEVDWSKSEAILSSLGAAVGAILIIMTAVRIGGKDVGKAAFTLIGMAVALGLMAIAFKIMATIECDEERFEAVRLAMVEMLLIFALIVAMSKFAGDNALKAGAMFILIALSIIMIAGAMAILAQFTWEQIGKGSAVVGGILLLFAIIIAATKNAQSAAATILAITFCLGLLIGAVALLASIGEENTPALYRALGIIVILMAGLAALMGAASLLNPASFLSILSIAAMLIVIAGALAALQEVPAYQLFGTAAAISMIIAAIAGAALIIGTLPGATSVLYGLAIAMLGVGAACLLVAGSFYIFAAAVNLLVTAYERFNAVQGQGGAGFEAMGAALADFLKGAISLIPALIGALIDGLTEALVSIIHTIGDNLVLIIDVIVQFIGQLLTRVVEVVPQLLSLLTQLISVICMAITVNFPLIVMTVINMLLMLINTIANNVARFIEAGANIIINFINGMAEKIPEVVQAGVNLILSLIHAIADALRGNGEAVGAALFDLFSGALEGLKGLWEFAKQKGKEILDKIIEAITGHDLGELLQRGRDMIDKIKDGIKEFDFLSIGTDIIQGLIDGLKNNPLVSRLIDAGKWLADKLGLGYTTETEINSPSKLFERYGKYVDEGLIIGVRSMGMQVQQTGEELGQLTYDSVANSVGDISSIFGAPGLTPINGYGQLQNAAFNTAGAMGISGYADGLTRMASRSTSTVNNNQPTFNIYQQPGQDPQDLARIINRELGRLLVV